MIQNSMAIKENEFMSKEKLQLLKAVVVLSKLGVKGDIIDEIQKRSQMENSKCLVGFEKSLIKIRNRYSNESVGYESIQQLLDQLEGGAENAVR